MAKEKLTGRVSYRLGGQVFRQVERQAAAQGVSPNEWCRQAVIEKLRGQSQATPGAGASRAAPRDEANQGEMLTRGEGVLVEELLRLRWLLQYGMRHYLAKKSSMNVEEWDFFVDQASGGEQFRDALRKWLRAHGLIRSAG